MNIKKRSENWPSFKDMEGKLEVLFCNYYIMKGSIPNLSDTSQLNLLVTVTFDISCYSPTVNAGK